MCCKNICIKPPSFVKSVMGAIKREMNNRKWTAFAIGYQCVFAYAVSLLIYQLGMLFSGAGNVIGSIAAFAVLGIILYLLLRPAHGRKSAAEMSA